MRIPGGSKVSTRYLRLVEVGALTLCDPLTRLLFVELGGRNVSELLEEDSLFNYWRARYVKANTTITSGKS